MVLIRLNWSVQKIKIIVIFCLLLLLVVANSIFLGVKNRQSVGYPSAEDIQNYSCSFLEGNKMENAGRRMDCSGFTKEVFKNFGIKIARSSVEQFRQSAPVNSKDLNTGNLIFFSMKNSDITHVGIFLENGKFIHSPGRGKYVRIDSLKNAYWNERFVSGSKIILD